MTLYQMIWKQSLLFVNILENIMVIAQHPFVFEKTTKYNIIPVELFHQKSLTTDTKMRINPVLKQAIMVV